MRRSKPSSSSRWCLKTRRARPAPSARNLSRPPSLTATRCSPHIVSISGFAAVDKLFGRQPKFTNADFIPIARIVADPIVLIANKDLPYKTLKDLVADAKANPDKLIYSSSGLYGASHIPTVIFAKAAGDLKIRHLPTNGGGPASPPCWAATSTSSCRRRRSPCRTSAPARSMRSPYRAPSATSRCPMCRPSRSKVTISNIISGSAFSRRRERQPRSSTSLREGLNKAAHSKQFLDTLENLGQELAYMDQPEFTTFWAADAKRQEDAINAIGRVQG